MKAGSSANHGCGTWLFGELGLLILRQMASRCTKTNLRGAGGRCQGTKRGDNFIQNQNLYPAVLPAACAHVRPDKAAHTGSIFLCQWGLSDDLEADISEHKHSQPCVCRPLGAL